VILRQQQFWKFAVCQKKLSALCGSENCDFKMQHLAKLETAAALLQSGAGG